MDEKKNDLITYICKTCQKDGFTFNDVKDVFFAVFRFYYDNARP